MEEKRTWSDAFAESLETLRKEIFETIFYDKQNKCFVESSDPMTFAEIMESAESDSFEEYDDLPEWNAENDFVLEKQFHTNYLLKIKPICEEWERQIMRAAANYDKHYVFEQDETATVHFTKFFDWFWERT